MVIRYTDGGEGVFAVHKALSNERKMTDTLIFNRDGMY